MSDLAFFLCTRFFSLNLNQSFEFFVMRERPIFFGEKLFQERYKGPSLVLTHALQHFMYFFSNSLIIHEEKQRKSIPWRKSGYVILIIIKFSEVLLWIIREIISLRIINALRSYIKHSKECFIRYPNISKLVEKNSADPCFFQPTSQCLDIWWNTLSCVWYITSTPTNLGKVPWFMTVPTTGLILPFGDISTIDSHIFAGEKGPKI